MERFLCLYKFQEISLCKEIFDHMLRVYMSVSWTIVGPDAIPDGLAVAKIAANPLLRGGCVCLIRMMIHREEDNRSG